MKLTNCDTDKLTKIRKLAVFTFARVQPAHLGHKKIFDVVHSIAIEQNGHPFIFPSKVGPDKGIRYPLDWDTKKPFLEELFPDHNIVYDSSVRDPFQALDYLEQQGFTDIVMVVGSDRVAEFETRFNKTKVVDKFETVSVISGGQRDDTNNISTMSSTLARAAAVNSDVVQFKKATGWTGLVAKELMEAVHNSIKEMNDVKRRKSIQS